MTLEDGLELAAERGRLMQALAQTGTMAAVGQASIQRRQVPQRSGGGRSGAISIDTSNSPRKNHDPAP